MRILFRSMLPWFLPTVTSAVVLSCRDGDRAVTPTSPTDLGLNADISDGAFGGNTRFFFLPPLVPAPTYGGQADGSLTPAVRVCEWNAASAQCSAIVADFNVGAGTGSESIRYDATAGNYIVNWHTDRCTTGACTLDVSKIYRLRVLIGNVELGYADIDPVSSPSDLRNPRTGNVIPLVNGRTLPIKFRIEKGAISLTTPGAPVSVDATGGTIASADGKVGLKIPAGALASPTAITVQPAAEYPAGVGAWTTPQQFGPDGTTFVAPVTLSLRYDPSALPVGVPASALRVAVATSGGWDIVPTSVVNRAENTVSAPVSHFSVYSIVIAPNTVSGQLLPTTLQPGQRTVIQANTTWAYQTTTDRICEPQYQYASTPSGGYWMYTGTTCYTPLQAQLYLGEGLAIYWESTAPDVASVSPGPTLTVAGHATTPFITGGEPGVATIRAICCGGVVSNAITITVQPPLTGPRIAFSRAGGLHQDNEIYVMRADGSGVTRLTNDPAPDEDPHFSPDGSKIAFSSFRNGNSEIWVMNADGANPVNLTNDGGFDAEPAWSPDGTRIAFNSCRGGNCDIYIMTANGTNLVRVTTDPTNDGQPSWSPDGRKLAWTSDRTGNFEIFVANADGSDVVQVTNDPSRDDNPAWSPDGRRIVFVRGSLPSTDVYVMNNDGSNVQRLTTDGASNYRPDWSPDGRIVFRTSRDGNPEIFVMQANGTGAVQLTATDASIGNNHPSWSGPFPTVPWEPGAIAFTSTRFGNSEIHLMPPNGIIPRRLTNHPAADAEADLSPDGTQVAFTSERSGNSEIWVMDVFGNNLRNLTNDGGFDGEPAWSPDGMRIAFNSCRGGNCDIYVVNADGTGLKRLTYSPANEGQPTWSPTGSVAFISDRTGNFEITEIAVDQAGSPEAPVTRLTTTPEREDYPAWSPDGQRIAFARNNDLYVMNSNGTNERRLTTDGALNERPSWTPDSQRLVFSARRGQSQFNLWEIDVATGQVRQLTSSAGDNNHPSIR